MTLKDLKPAVEKELKAIRAKWHVVSEAIKTEPVAAKKYEMNNQMHSFSGQVIAYEKILKLMLK